MAFSGVSAFGTERCRARTARTNRIDTLANCSRDIISSCCDLLRELSQSEKHCAIDSDVRVLHFLFKGDDFGNETLHAKLRG